MSTGARQASNTLHTVHALLLSGALYPSIPLPSLSGVFVFVCDCVGACEFLCDVKSCSVYLLSLCLMRCKQKAVSMQPLPALHQGCKHLAASLCFLQKKKENSQGRNLILARHFLVFTSRKSQGENSLLSRKACVCIWWSWCLWPLRLVVTVAGGDGNNAVLTFARVGICQCCVTTVELPLLGWLISVSLGSRF